MTILSPAAVFALDALLHSAALVRITRCAHARGTELGGEGESSLSSLLFAFFFSFFSIIRRKYV